MALTRTAYAAANTADFAAALKSALEATSLFDSVTRSETTVTCTKDSQALLTVNCAASADSTDVIALKNGAGTDLLGLKWGYGVASTAASISTDGSFVFVVLTNSYTNSGGAVRRAVFLFVGRTKAGKVGIAVSYTDSATDVLYPQTGARICSEESLAADNGTAFAPARSANYGYVLAYPLTVQKSDGSIDTFDGAYGVLAAPGLYACARTVMGVLPPKITIDGKDYITDGCILIEVEGATA